MSTYAQQADIERYIEGWVTSDPIALERLIRRAESDLEPLLFPMHNALPPTQVITIKDATGGSFTLQWAGPTPGTTSPLVFNSLAAALQSALQALPGIASNVVVLGAYPVWTVMWSRFWASTVSTQLQVPVLGVDVSGLLPVGASVVVSTVRGRKIDPVNDLNANQALGLSDATAAQVEYRAKMGEAFFVRPQYSGTVSGPDFRHQGRLPRVSPKARWELSQTGLMYTAGRAVAGIHRRGVARGWPNY